MDKKIIRIPTSLDDFFKCWLIFLLPLHNLTNREIEVAASFYKKRYELSKNIINDDALLDSITLNEQSRKEIRLKCKLSPTHFQVIMSKLRKVRLIENNRFNLKFLPCIEKDKDQVQLMILFDVS
jgi:hypothetical protein